MAVYRRIEALEELMKGLLIVISLIVLWITLNRWVLPWFGIPTCMSGGCAADRCPPDSTGPWTSENKDVTQPKGDKQ
jgi:hypothetical protein